MLQIGRLVMIQRILMPPVIAILLDLLSMMRIDRGGLEIFNLIVQIFVPIAFVHGYPPFTVVSP